MKWKIWVKYLFMTEPIKDGKLTKKFYLSLPEGVFLVRGVGDSPWEKSFAEYVVSDSERERQWKRIVAAIADQRNCGVFKTEQDQRDWVAKWFGKKK